MYMYITWPDTGTLLGLLNIAIIFSVCVSVCVLFVCVFLCVCVLDGFLQMCLGRLVF